MAGVKPILHDGPVLISWHKEELLKEVETFQRLNCADIFMFIVVTAATGPKYTAPGPETAQL